MVVQTSTELASTKTPPHAGSMHKSGLRQSGSNWSIDHINTLHVHRVDTIEFNRFFPAHMLADNDPDFLTLRCDLMTQTYQQLKRGVVDENFLHNPFLDFFQHLSTAIRTGQVEDEAEDEDEDA